jgi:hypothetical protein
MASIIRIKRSGTATSAPTPLANGELAYSAASGSQENGGDRLYIGFGTETAGNAANTFVIGGKYFTDLLDHVHGTLTANSAIIVDSNKKIDVLNVDNLTIDGNTISSTNTNGNIVLDPVGTGYVQIEGTNGLVIPVGTTLQQGPAIQGTIRFNSDISQFEGYLGNNWSSLGGVRSVDGLTFITAESSPGASNDTLDFVTNGTQALSIDTDSIDVATKITTVNINATTVSDSHTTGALVVDGGVGIAGNLNVNGTISVTGGQALAGDFAINGGDLFSTASTFNLLNKDSDGSTTSDGPSTVNAFLGAATVNIGSSTGTTTINHNANILLDLDVDGNLNVDGTAQIDGATTIGASGARSNLSVFGATVSITGSNTTTMGVDAATGAAITYELRSLNSVGDAHLDINVKNDVTIDSTTISIDSTDNSNFTVTSNSSSNKNLVINAVNTGSGNAIIDFGSSGTNNINITSSDKTTVATDELEANIDTLDINARVVTIDTTGTSNSLQVTSTTTTVNSSTVTFQGAGGSATDMTLTMTGQLNVDNIRVDGNTISTTDESNQIIIDPAPVNDNGGTVIIKGNLQVDGTTTTINSSQLKIDDPVITLGGALAPTADDNLDRGVKFNWFDTATAAAKIGFFGYDDSASEFIFLNNATDSNTTFAPAVAGAFGNLKFGKLTIVDTTESATATSGSVVIAGGLGISKNIVTGADIVGAGPATSDITGFNIDGGTY